MNIDVGYLLTSLRSGLLYVGITTRIAFISIAVGTVLSVFVALARFRKIPVLSQFLAGFFTIYQGIPMMVLLLIYHLLYVRYFDSFAAFFHLPVTINDVDITVIGYFAMILGTVTGVSEAFRGALHAVDRTQFEACASTGMTGWQGLRRIILPQMFKVAFPSYMNNVISTIKGIPLLSAVGIIEMMNGCLLPCAKTYRFIEGYTAAAIMYFVFIMVILYIARIVEKKMNHFTDSQYA